MEPQPLLEQSIQTNPVLIETAPTRTLSFRTRMVLAFVAGLLIAIVAGYFYYTSSVDVAAVVNGTRITKTEVEENISMMTKSAEQQGIDVSDPAVASEIKTQALENLINNQLLIGAAQVAGMTANEAAVQTAYDSLVSEVGGEEELKTRMETVGLSVDTLLGNISDRLVVDQYIESATDIEVVTVSEEEIAAYIDSISTDGVTLPPLEEIRPQIESTILAQKQQGVVDELIAKLRSEATIDIKD